jgi:hypothetical protein
VDVTATYEADIKHSTAVSVISRGYQRWGTGQFSASEPEKTVRFL